MQVQVQQMQVQIVLLLVTFCFFNAMQVDGCICIFQSLNACSGHNTIRPRQIFPCAVIYFMHVSLVTMHGCHLTYPQGQQLHLFYFPIAHQHEVACISIISKLLILQLSTNCIQERSPSLTIVNVTLQKMKERWLSTTQDNCEKYLMEKIHAHKIP